MKKTILIILFSIIYSNAHADTCDDIFSAYLMKSGANVSDIYANALQAKMRCENHESNQNAYQEQQIELQHQQNLLIQQQMIMNRLGTTCTIHGNIIHCD